MGELVLTTYDWVPVPPRGLVRDFRVRWALEEAGLPYEVVLIDPQIQASAHYHEWQPFGQVPAYRDETVEMFESGAIVLHIAAKSEALSPRDEAGRARVTSTPAALAAPTSMLRMSTATRRKALSEASARKTSAGPAVRRSAAMQHTCWVADASDLTARFSK